MRNPFTIFKKFLTKQSKTFPAILLQTLGRPVFTERSFRKLSDVGYKQNTYVYAAVKEVSDTAASVPWILKRKRGDSEKEILDHPLLTLINNPNPLMGRVKFFQNVIGYLMLSGNSYIERVGPGDNDARQKPRELWPLRPDRMQVVPGTSINLIAGYVYTVNGESTDFDEPMIRHVKTFNPTNDFYGLSPIAVSGRSIDQNNEAKAWNVSLLQNMARPPGALTTEHSQDEEEFNRLRLQIDEEISGKDRAGRPLLLSGGMKWQQMSLSPIDMDWMASQKMSAKEIAITFGVAPELLGDSDNKTYSNFAEARKALYVETVIPLLEFLRWELNSWLVPLFGSDLMLDFDTDDIAALQEDKEKLWSRVQNANWLMVNEKRRATGFDDVDGGDVIMVPVNLVPLGTAPLAQSTTKNLVLQNKTFNMDTAEQKELYWKTFDARRFRWLEQVKRMVIGRLRNEENAIKNAIKSSSSVDAVLNNVDGAIDQGIPEWQKLIGAIYMGVGDDFADSVFSSVKGTGPDETKQEPRDIWLEEITNYISTQGGDKIVTPIVVESKNRVRKELIDGVSEGEGVDKLSERIDNLFQDSILPSRSEVIARTEIIRASNLGSRAGAIATGLPLQKEWLSTKDGRTRGAGLRDKFDHITANGQRQKRDDPFIVSGERLMFPGDISFGASAGNVIQCRCTEVYHVSRG